MKKLLVVVVLVGVGGFVAWNQLLRPEKRACAKLTELCGPSANKDQDCDAQMKELRQSLGAEATQRFDTCVADAKSCAEASGCMMGASANAMGKAVNDFFKGLGKGLSK